MSSEKDDENNSGSESDLDDDKHNKLIENVLYLNKRLKLKKPTRTEPALHISEFDLVKSSTGKEGVVQLKDLTKSLKKTSKYVSLAQHVEAIKRKTKSLSKPLEKPQTDRIRRTIAYEETKKQLNRWDPIVTSNRAASTLRFPLNDDINLDTNAKAEDYFNWKKTKLQLALEKVTVPEVEVIEVRTEKEEFPLTMEEMIEKRNETAKLRAVQSYKEAKARRQNKIKSKKFHKIERKAKAKQQLKEFEDLQKINPEAALLKLEELEKARAQERFSLRHKSTGQWAKNKQIRAKYDKESRQALAEQLAISRDLTQKLKKTDSDLESDEDDSKQVMPSINVDADNPWTGNAKIKPNEEVANFISNVNNFRTDQIKLDKYNTVTLNSQGNEQDAHLETVTDLKSQIKNSTKSPSPENKKFLKGTKKGEYEVKKASQIKREESSKKIENKESCEYLFKKGLSHKSSIKKIGKLVQSTLELHNKKKKHSDATDIIDGIDQGGSNLKIRRIDKNKGIHIEESPGSLWIVSTVLDDKLPTNNGVDDIFDNLDMQLKEKVRRKLDNLMKTKKKIARKRVVKSNKLNSKIVKSNFQMLELRKERRRLRVNDGLSEGDDVDGDTQLVDLKRLEGILEKTRSIKKNEEIDPNKFINMVPVKLNTKLPDVLINECDENDDSGVEDSLSKNQKDVISEAFCDDNIVKDFNKDKQNEITKKTPQDIDLIMPGWGSWGGKNLKVPKWKRRRFVLKAPKPEVRKDSNRGNVIINEDENNAKLAQHMVSDVPFPYKDVKEFEISLKTPIDATFIPQTAFRKFIEPPVIRKMGTIIEPMTEEILLKKKQSTIH